VPVEPPVTSPRVLAEAYALLAEGPARPIAGGTDVMVALTGEIGEPPARMLDLWRLDELRGIALDGDVVSLGALTTYTDIRRSAVCHEHLPVLIEAAATIGAAQIQNRGTLGGNIANASPAGDTLPVLLAADASFVLGSVRGERTVPAAEFWPAYRRTALAPDELLLRIRIPLLAGREMRFRKVGTRQAQSISKVVMALVWRDGGAGVAPGTTPGAASAWTDVRLALGSVAATPIRATATEAAIEGRAPTLETADRAAETLAGELQPIDDVRSTAEYRRLVAARVLHRLIRQAGGW
jgi:xanthine dehydrogenase small subunit